MFAGIGRVGSTPDSPFAFVGHGPAALVEVEGLPIAQRIKGQETEVSVVRNGRVDRAITAIQSFEMTVQLETLDEGYLGETTNRKDEIYKGVSGTIELHLETADVFALELQVVDRARRRTPGVKINIKTTLRYPNGDRVRVLIPDIFIGSPSLRAGSRQDYLSKRLEFVASDYQII